MFKKQPSIEHEYMNYNSDDVIGKHAPKTSFLTTVIRILTVLILLGVLVIGAVFGYRFLQNDDVEKKPLSIPEKTVHVTKEEKMYTQDEMQAIMQMMMQNLEKNQEKEPTETTESQTPKNKKAEDALIASLKGMEADFMEDLDLSAELNETDSTKEITKSNDDKNVNNYNKVLVKKSTSPYGRVDELSLEIGKIVKKMEEKKSTRKSAYTKSITKEVSTRKNAMRIIIVKKGDTLSQIAKRAYGSALAYDKLYSANPDLAKNPNHIFVGQRLRIPLTK